MMQQKVNKVQKKLDIPTVFPNKRPYLLDLVAGNVVSKLLVNVDIILFENKTRKVSLKKLKECCDTRIKHNEIIPRV